jgi:hypothetical protein
MEIEMSGWTIYWIGILDNLSFVFTAISVLSLIVLVIWAMIKCITSSTDDEVCNAFTKATSGITCCCKILLFVCVPLAAITPSSKTAAAIYILPKIVNNETIKTESEEIYSLGKQWLKSQIEETKTERESK